MYRDQLHFNRRPFQESIDTAFFFSGGDRRDVLDDIKNCLTQSIPLMVVTGPEGIGKTMLCRMVEKELPVGLTSVYIPRSIESFDDMLRIVAMEIGVGQQNEELPAETQLVLNEIIEALKARAQRLVIFFDEAEKTYLATLERIRKLLDQVNADDIYIQILLAGRALLKENLEQLKIVEFEPAEERYFTLDPLGEEAVWAYLNYCIRVGSGESVEIFDQQIASQIYQASGGVFQQINIHANEYLQDGGSEPSFMGLLDNIDEKPAVIEPQTETVTTARKKKRRAGTGPDFWAVIRNMPGWLFYGGSGVVILILVLMVMNRSGNQPETSSTESPTQDPPPIEYQEVESQPVEPEQELLSSTGSKPDDEQTTVAQVDTVEQAEPPPIIETDLVDTQGVAGESATVDTMGPAETPAEQKPQSTTPQSTSGASSPPAPAATPAEKPPEIAIIADGRKKVVPQKTPPTPQPTAQSSSSGSEGVDTLFLKRLAAGARWLVGASADKFTVQLMVLTSEKAEENLKNMLRTKEYRDIADQLYILRRVGNITTIMVFFGEYPTLAAARSARNNLPIFLRKHHPYAIAVHGAVEKAKTAQ
ncbi:MAG: AAA family ATPase [Desulfobulbaceae bacterium]|nr:MAG: AAA family ATPase [Desulfobulbaceae bacterium]